MKAKLIRIGNSQGIRIPKPLIEQCGLGKSVELTVKDNVLTISPERAVRAGWKDTFKAMAAAGDDAALLPDDVTSDWDETEWEW